MHKHTTTCRKKGNKKCRFQFPKPPLYRTVILYPLEAPDFSKQDIAKHKELWKNISQELDIMSEDENATVQTLLEKFDLDWDQYIIAIRASINTPTVFLKRSPQEVRVNGYNSNILKAWKANLDVQFILDVYACATYVASYITKSQRGMSELLQKASVEARDGNKTLKEQIQLVGNKFLNAVEIGAQETAYICLQLPMKKCSRQTIFLNTSPPEERVSLLKPASLLDIMKDDDDDIECSNIITRYCERPQSIAKISFAEYAAFYDAPPCRLVNRSNSKKSKHLNFLPEPHTIQNDDEEQADETSSEPELKRRKKARIIRFVHFNNVDNEPEKYFRELIMLFSPWRRENDLKNSCKSYQDRYLQIKEEIKKERVMYEPFREAVDEAQRIINDELDLEEAWDQIAPHTESENAEDIANKTTQPDVGIENYDIGLDIGVQPSVAEAELIKQHELSDEEFRQHMRRLNKQQIEFVYDTIHVLKTSQNTCIYSYLTGGAGTGKSTVTIALYQMTLKFYNKRAGEEFTTKRMLLLAPTGKASYHIHGNTIHSALKIPANQKLQFKPLSSSALNTLRNKIGEVKLIFIDEISMVGFNMLNFINQRLMEVTQKKEIFGGISVIAVGDLLQLKPVMDSYMFMQPSSGYLPLATNIWETNFAMFELMEIMRQADNKPFAELLNRLREGNQTNEDISVLKQQLIDTTTHDKQTYPWNTPHLFATNDKVDAFNSTVIHRSGGPVRIIKAKDTLVGSVPPTMKTRILDSFKNNKQNTKHLSNQLEAAENIYYEITINLDTSDGLINGASCKMMRIETPPSSEYASGILWVKFDDPNIGKQLRGEKRRQYKRVHQRDWTPLEPVTKSYAAGSKGQFQIHRCQFPLRPAHAKTVHRSQGDTMKSVVVDLSTKRRVDHLHYVALSRVQTLDGLSIINLQEDKIGIDKNVKEEMKRLRDKPMTKSLTNLYNIDNSNFKICFLNASSLHRHIEDVRADRNIKAADIACFSETRFHQRDSQDVTKVESFHQYRQDAETSDFKRPSHGLAIYSKHKLCPDGPYNESVSGIEICVFRTKTREDLTIVVVYKPPNKPVIQLCEQLHHVHKKYIADKKAIFIGDFNVDWNQETSTKQQLLSLMVNQLNYHQIVLEPTNDHNSTIDLIFTNSNIFETGT